VVTTKTADRYVRTGTDVPQIYSGNLKGVSAALGDVERLSKKHPGTHHLDAVYGKERVTLFIYEAGTATFVAEQPT
jgi:hypothetical protein